MHLGRDHGIRAAIRDWEKRPILAGLSPDGQLGQIVEVMLGTSARIGEVLAIRVADLDLDVPVPTVRICGTIVSRKGEPTHRQDHPKTARSVRRVAPPGFALRAVRARFRYLRFIGPEALLFAPARRPRRLTPAAEENVLGPDHGAPVSSLRIAGVPGSSGPRVQTGLFAPDDSIE